MTTLPTIFQKKSVPRIVTSRILGTRIFDAVKRVLNARIVILITFRYFIQAVIGVKQEELLPLGPPLLRSCFTVLLIDVSSLVAATTTTLGGRLFRRLVFLGDGVFLGNLHFHKDFEVWASMFSSNEVRNNKNFGVSGLSVK